MQLAHTLPLIFSQVRFLNFQNCEPLYTGGKTQITITWYDFSVEECSNGDGVIELAEKWTRMSGFGKTLITLSWEPIKTDQKECKLRTFFLNRDL